MKEYQFTRRVIIEEWGIVYADNEKEAKEKVANDTDVEIMDSCGLTEIIKDSIVIEKEVES